MYLKQVNLLHPLIIVIFAYTPAVSPDKLTFFLIFSLSLTFSTGLVYFFQNIYRKGVRICDFSLGSGACFLYHSILKRQEIFYEQIFHKKWLPLRQHFKNHRHHRHGNRPLCRKHHPLRHPDAAKSNLPGTPRLHGDPVVEHLSGHALHRKNRLPDLLLLIN